MSSCANHPDVDARTPDGPRLALLGSPNSGKTTLFNALTGLRAKTGNYPGVTVARFEGAARVGGRSLMVEDLPGTYSLDPMSPDEQIVVDVLEHESDLTTPDGLVVTLDATTLRRSLGLLAHILQTEVPVCVVLTFTDELIRRQGAVDIAALRRALSVPVVAVVAGRARELGELRDLLPEPTQWQQPAVLPPTDTAEVSAWIESVLSAAHYVQPQHDERTRRVDAVLLHPVWGTLIFFTTMFAFFQVIFTVAAPLQEGVEGFFGYLGGLVDQHVSNQMLGSFLSGAMLGGVGGVLVFLPQIALLFLMVSLLEGVGYMSRAAFLMDRVMAGAGLEGRAFVALLSSLACAIPGIMATRTLPSARDRIATMMGAPLMTCSARLPVYVLLIGLLVSPDIRWGPIGAQGAVMFALYLVGAISAMASAWVFSRIGRGHGPLLPFYMEMPPYRLPSLRSVLISVWEPSKGFLLKVGKIILVTTIVLWVLLNLPARSTEVMSAAGVDPGDNAAASAYVIDNSYAASVGRFVSPVFEPLGFDWRINVGVLASLSAREVFVSTLGQVAAAEDPDDPARALEQMTVQEGPRAGEKLFTPPVVAALLAFFLYALQCMSTVGVMRRESGSWRWPAIAFGYMFALAWGMALLAHTIVTAVT
ncbi:MAG: ferrous iron transporter B [Actinomycetia bacterium]|nr:ferrous iron transporter B [Actinomycetes bacterium]MCH9759506.1 ferrous iron transporter B [Actinomycetes bacterium]